MDVGGVVKPENPKQLAKKIQYVFDYPVEAKEKGKKAREKCKREYSWEMMEKNLIAIFGSTTPTKPYLSARLGISDTGEQKLWIFFK